jgi:L-glyceraldehyde 3-phosphate reductase
MAERCSFDAELKLKKRRVGSTDLSISEIGFGCGGNAGLMVRGELREQVRTVARALELGINYFDNSPDYGDGAAERNLGSVLREICERPLLNSKVEIRAHNLKDIAGHVVTSTEESLRRLGVDYLDVLQIHNGPTALPPKLEGKAYTHLWIEDFLAPGGAIDGALRLKRAGKVRHIGFICRGNDGTQVRQLLETGLFSLINVPYTLLNPSAGRAMPEGLTTSLDFGNVISAAAACGAGSAIYAPLAGGFLTDDAIKGAMRHRLARQQDPATDVAMRQRARAQTFAFLAQETGMSLAQTAFRFILDHAAVTVALGGFSSVEQMEEIAAAAHKPSLNSFQMARIESIWRSNFSS